MNNGILLNKSIDFSIQIINCYKWLCENKKEFVMSKQLLRSGTSIGANIHEAQFAASRTEFLDDNFKHLNDNCVSLKRMLIATLRTSKNNI